MYKISFIDGKYCIFNTKACRFICSCYNVDNANAIVNILWKDDKEHEIELEDELKGNLSE